MIKTNPHLREHVQGKAKILIHVPQEYHNATELWSATPRMIVAQLRSSGEVHEVKLMSCYASKAGDTLQITTLRPAGVFKDNLAEDKTVLDAYMPMVLEALKEHGRVISARRVLIQSQGMPFIYDHLLDAGFKLRNHAITNGGVYEFEEDPNS